MRDGLLKGKLAYMAPEQTRGVVDRRADVYAAAVVLWELLTGRRLFVGDSESSVLSQVLAGAVASPREVDPSVGDHLSEVVMRGLALEPEERFWTAREMALAVERCGVAAPSEVGAWVEGLARETLEARTRTIAEVERDPPAASAPSVVPARARRAWLPAAVTMGSVGLVLVAGGVLYGPHATTLVQASGSASASASASASESESESESVSEPESVSASSQASPPRAHTRPARPSCDPPYRIDAQGVHRYKPECLVPR